MNKMYCLAESAIGTMNPRNTLKQQDRLRPESIPKIV